MTSGDTRFLSEAAGGVAGQRAAGGAKPKEGGPFLLPAGSGRSLHPRAEGSPLTGTERR